MPSLISGYECDVFISYRHKDNKGRHWVTKFVNALKTELEATFKEDITIYFDKPYDGLQETHNVDKSLEGKLKCLIFIPILSQTYCARFEGHLPGNTNFVCLINWQRKTNSGVILN